MCVVPSERVYCTGGKYILPYTYVCCVQLEGVCCAFYCFGRIWLKQVCSSQIQSHSLSMDLWTTLAPTLKWTTTSLAW